MTVQTRQKLRETYNAEFAAIIERAEKQIILARHGQRLLKLLDDSPVVPGDSRPTYNGASQARQVLNDAEDDIRDWRPEPEDDRDAPRREERQPQQDLSSKAGGLGKEGGGSGSRRRGGDSVNVPRNGQGYDAANDYEGGSQVYDISGDRDGDGVGQDSNRGAQSASDRMMFGGSGPSGPEPAILSAEADAPDDYGTSRASVADV